MTSPTALGLNQLGDVLRLLRHEAGMSRDSLAQSAAVSTGAISNYENDVSSPPATVLRRICRALAGSLDRPVAELWADLGVVLDHLNDNTDGQPLGAAPSVQSG